MNVAVAELLRSVRVGNPSSRAGFTICPLLTDSAAVADYLTLSPDTLEMVEVTEVSEEGRVSELLVSNRHDAMIFLMDGQELVGAKQNRILNTDVLVPAGSAIRIPVSCVESGRWKYRGERFSPGKNASHRIRASKQARVRESLERGGGFDADQGEVWNEVSCSMARAGASSETNSLNDAYTARAKELEAFCDSLAAPANCTGIAILRGGQLLGIDLFDCKGTLDRFWRNILESYAIEWVASEDANSEGPLGDDAGGAVERALEHIARSEWNSYQSPGEGADLRLVNDQYAGSALLLRDRTLVHLQAFPVDVTQAMNGEASRKKAKRNNTPPTA